MRIKSNFKVCSICLKEKELTFEHIIPESLGGILESDIQCADCNNRRLGSELVSKAKKTFTIRLAINNLKTKLPKLFKEIEEGQGYIAHKIDQTTSEAVLRNGKIKSKAEKSADGYINVDRLDTEKKLKEILRKEGLNKEEIDEKISEFKKIDINKPYELTDTVTVIKRAFVKWFQKPSEAYIDERVIVLIAYNYLCMVTGEGICDYRMNFIRDFILNGTKTDNLIIEQIPFTNEYAPYHKIFSEPSDTEIKVTIVLFGSIISIVTVKNLSVPKKYNWILVQELEERSVLISDSFEAVKRREIYKA